MDTGATAIFIMEGTPVENKRIAKKPLTINLPDGTKIKSTHCCDITVPGLPTILTGHIVPSLSIASLIGVRVLCEAGCTVTFCKDHCDVIYNGILILKGCKDPNTNLWTIPINATHFIRQPRTRYTPPGRTQSSIQLILPTLSRRGQTKSNLHTNLYAIPRYPRS